MDAAAELGRNPVSKHQFQPAEYGNEQADAGRDRGRNPSRETKFSGANADREIFIFPVQLNTSLIHVCVFFPFILDVKFVGCTSRGHTGGRSHRISHPPPFCGACLYFSREKNSAVPFPRRP